jgi:hypothetical protein
MPLMQGWHAVKPNPLERNGIRCCRRDDSSKARYPKRGRYFPTRPVTGMNKVCLDILCAFTISIVANIITPFCKKLLHIHAFEAI